jgi:hypothetical protein
MNTPINANDNKLGLLNWALENVHRTLTEFKEAEESLNKVVELHGIPF